MAMAQATSRKRHSLNANLDKLKSHFDSLDRDRTGYIGYSELKKLVQNVSDLEEAVLPELMEKLDRDKDGKVSFDDFRALFEVQHDKASAFDSDKDPQAERVKLTAPESVGAPHATGTRPRRQLPETPTVVLRTRRGRSQPPGNSREFGHLSPIRGGGSRSRPPSIEFPEMAPGQMQYLMTGFEMTDSVSPQLKRNSKVLSFTDEVLEGLGDGFRQQLDSSISDVPSSPPTSPGGGPEEVSQVVAVLQSVIKGKEVDCEAISRLCAHVDADRQEQEELITLLNFLDKRKVGHVTIEEFVRGLQACKNTAAVSSTPYKTPEHFPPRRHTISTSIPRLSEPLSTPVHSVMRQVSSPLASTPLHQPAYSNLVLSVLDPDKSGYVKVDNLAEQIQQMGVETEHNSSIEEALAEAVTVDQTGRVSINEFTTSLESALLTEGKTNNFLRQIALKTFHNEIHSLRTQVNQISLERDNLQQNLNRTMDENKKLVVMGEEQVELITKDSERKLKKRDVEYSQRLRDTERSYLEDQRNFQDLYRETIEKLQQNIDDLKNEEEKLRADLKLTQEENMFVDRKLQDAHNDITKKENLIRALQRELESASDIDLIDDGQQLTRAQELENELMETVAQVNNLQDRLREMSDKYDLLTEENERLKQKYLSAKRDLQRRRTSSKRRTSGDYGRTQKPKRPLSGAPYGRSSPIKPRILRSPLDLAIGSEKDHPVLLEDMDDEQSSEPSDVEHPVLTADPQEELEADLPPLVMAEESETEIGSTTSSNEGDTPEDDSLSGASLMEEISKQEKKSMLENKINQLEEERQRLKQKYQQLELQLKESEEEERQELVKELERTKQKQLELDRLIVALGKQSKRLSKTRMEIDSRLQVAEKSLASQLQGLRSSLTENTGGDSTNNLADLVEELDSMRQQLENQRTSHEDDISKLKLQLSQAEEDSYSQIDLSLKLEEEKAAMAEDLSSMKDTLESERNSHETEVNVLLRKLENAELSVERLKQHEEQALVELGAELKSSRDEVSTFRAKCDQAQEKYENLLVQVRELKDRETDYLDKFKQLDRLHKEELTQLQAEIESQQDEIEQLRTAQVVPVKEVTVSPKRTKPPRGAGEDEADFIPQPYTPRKISYTSSPASHDAIIGQMKGELEELQRILLLQSKGSSEASPGLALVQQLLASNEALEREFNQAKQVLVTEKQELSKQLVDKETDLIRLQEVMAGERKALESSTEAVSQEMAGLISSLQSVSESSLSEYEIRLNKAVSKIVHLQKLLQEKAKQHGSTVESLNTELRESKHETSTCKQEIIELKQEIAQAKEHGIISAQEHVEVIALHKREMEILTAEIEKANSQGQLVRERSEMIEQQLRERDQELAARDNELQCQSERIYELESRLKDQLNEQIDTEQEAMEVRQLEGVNEALLLNTNQDSRERLVITRQISAGPPEGPTDSDSEQLTVALQEANEKLEAFKQVQHTIEFQHQQALLDIESKYEAELSATNEVIEEHTSELRQLYVTMATAETDRAGTLTHSQLVREIEKEIKMLKNEIFGQEEKASELESSLNKRAAEYDQFETQIQTEHDEEVSALHQQRDQLSRLLNRQLEELKQRCAQQEQQSTGTVKELEGSVSSLERQLRLKSEECLMAYQKMSDLSDEKSVLFEIIEHLCLEAGKLIDVV